MIASHAILLLTPLAPLLAALMLLNKQTRPRVSTLLPWMAVPGLACSIFTPSDVLSLPWMLMGANWGLDQVGRVFLGFTSLLWGVTGWFAGGYLQNDPRRHAFFGFFLLAMAGNFGLIVARDFASFYAFFALMSFAAYPLIIHDRAPESLRAGRVYLSFVIVGEVCLFAALLLLTHEGGSSLPVSMSKVSPLVMLMLFVGFGIKVGALPLHGWLPLAHPAAPIPASAVLSGAMIKAGLFGWIRFIPAGVEGTGGWSTGLIIIGLLGAFYGVAIGVKQVHPKRILAYSSISQMGLMTLGVGIGIRYSASFETTAAAVGIFAAHHGLAKGALFLGVSISRHPPAWPRSIFLCLLSLPALSLAGFPLTSGAVAKIAFKSITNVLPDDGVFIVGWLLAFSSVGTTCLMIRFLSIIWLTKENPNPNESQLHGPVRAWATLCVIGLIGVWIWSSTLPWALKSLASAKIWSALWPMVAGSAMMLWYYKRVFRHPNQTSK